MKKLLSLTLIVLNSVTTQAMLTDETLLKKVNLSDHEFLSHINANYPEMVRLTEAVRGSPESQRVDNEHSPSKKLFGKQHIEFDRTAVGILAVKWVLTNNYAQFVTGQPESLKLKKESFDALRRSTLLLVERKQLNALITSLALNDLGKVIAFCKEVEQRKKSEDIDHDNVLLTALHKYPDLVPSFKKLSTVDQEMILKGMGAQFNLGQFVQAENLPANLKGLCNLSQNELDFHNLHTLFDVSGALGHVSSQGSLVLTEPTYQSFAMAFKALSDIPSALNDRSLIDAYDHYLTMRTAQLTGESIKTLEDRTVARLAFMIRVDNADQFNEVKSTFAELPNTIQKIFVDELNKMGIDDHGILLYYAPSVLVNAKAAFKQNPKDGLRIALSYLAELFTLVRAKIVPNTKNGVYIVDCAALANKIKTPAELETFCMELEAVGNNARVLLKPKV